MMVYGFWWNQKLWSQAELKLQQEVRLRHAAS
jgi:hypothetical protein